MAEPLEFEIRLKKNEADIQKLADSFQNRIEHGLKDAIRKLGLGNFGPISAGGGGGGAGGGGFLSNLSSATKTGMAAGLVAGGVVGLLGVIADCLKDMPIITGIMKMFKLIITILLLPLIPILKPALLALAGLAKWLATVMKPTEGTSQGDIVGALVGGIVGLLLGGPVGAAVGASVGAALAQVFQKLGWKAVVGYIIEGLGKVFGLVVERFFPWIIDNIILPMAGRIVETLGNAFGGIVSVLQKIGDVFKGLWDGLVETLGNAFGGIVSVLQKIGDVFKGLWDGLVALLNKIPGMNIKTTPTNTAPSYSGGWVDNGGGNSNADTSGGTPITWTTPITSPGGGNAIGTANPGGANMGESLYPSPSYNNPVGALYSDFLMTPQGTIRTDPNDFIIGTKNPGGLGGGSTININIDKPTLTGEADIKNLVRSISQELYKQQRRYVSYA